MRTLIRTTLVIVSALATSAFADPFERIHVAVNRHQYVGRACPIDIIYTASINLAPHPRGLVFQYHWERSDGAKGPVHVMHPGPNQRTIVVHDKWRLGGAGHTYDASETIHVGSGNTRMSETSAAVHVECR